MSTERHRHEWHELDGSVEGPMLAEYEAFQRKAHAAAGWVYDYLGERFLFCVGCEVVSMYFPGDKPVREARTRPVVMLYA